MKYNVLLLCLVSIMFLVIGSSSAQIFLDGDSTDWVGEPVLANWVHNVDVSFPSEVKATTTDVVDVKQIKAKIQGSALYAFIRFWGGPVWPSEVDQTVRNDGNTYTRSRGYYHIMIDLDNDPATGWDNTWYENHYTPVGYLADTYPQQGFDKLGAEAVVYWGSSYRWPVDNTPEGGVIETGGGVEYVEYACMDASEYIGNPENDVFWDLFGTEIADPDSSDGMAWNGALRIDYSEQAGIEEDTLIAYFFGHAWADGDTPAGDDFIEMAFDLNVIKKYFSLKDGSNYLNPGDILGLSAFIETPAEDWAIDVSHRGELTVPEFADRSAVITFDGDSTDWAGLPVLADWVHNVDVSFPSEVKATTTDVVDVKQVKAVCTEDALNFFIRFWGGPVWPSEVDQTVRNDGNTYTRSRGYYHIMIDLDNDPATGWDNTWYENHYTPVGYLADTYPQQGFDKLGAEAVVYWGSSYRWPVDNTPEGGVIETGGGVEYVEYACMDASEYIGNPENDVFWDLFGTEVTDADSGDGMQFNGMCLIQYSEQESALLDGVPYWFAHAWADGDNPAGDDFLEMGFAAEPIRKYFMAKSGISVLQPNDVLGISAFIETPAEDWAIDVSHRGEVSLVTGIFGRNMAEYPDKFALENNYPNPFNPVTTIDFRVPKTADVSLVVYNALGQKVRSLIDGSVQAGKHSVQWNGRNDAGNMLSSGIYFYTLRSDATNITKKMVLMK